LAAAGDRIAGDRRLIIDADLLRRTDDRGSGSLTTCVCLDDRLAQRRSERGSTAIVDSSSLPTAPLTDKPRDDQPV
jgi:hypothetical protein